jgi:hypothetical protein
MPGTNRGTFLIKRTTTTRGCSSWLFLIFLLGADSTVDLGGRVGVGAETLIGEEAYIVNVSN